MRVMDHDSGHVSWPDLTEELSQSYHLELGLTVLMRHMCTHTHMQTRMRTRVHRTRHSNRAHMRTNTRTNKRTNTRAQSGMQDNHMHARPDAAGRPAR